MNPEENGGGMPAVDFTGGSDSGLSMSDSLASAQEDLTSAGMAAGDAEGGAMSLDEISASDSSATMARPDEPLIPAAPVPGSIGSVTSGPSAMPAVDTTPAADAAGAAPVAAGAPVAGAGLAGAASVASAAPMIAGMPAGAPMGAPAAPTAAPAAGPFTPVDPAVANPSGTGASPAMAAAGASGVPAGISGTQMTPEAMNAAMAGASAAMQGMPAGTPAGMAGTPAPAAAPYNPFAAQPGAGMGPKQSSTAVPMGLQPKTERFSKGATRGGNSPMAMVLGIVAAVGVIAAGVFCFLWLQAQGKERIVYVQQGPAEQEIAPPEDVVMNCTRPMTSEEIASAQGMPGLASGTSSSKLTFKSGELKSMVTDANFVFQDAASAEATRPSFDLMVTAMTLANAEGTPAMSATYEITDANAKLSTVMNIGLLKDMEGTTLTLPKDEDGEYMLDPDTVKEYFDGENYTCTEE